MVAMLPDDLVLNRSTGREHVKIKFRVNQMVNGYKAVYEHIIKNRINLNVYIHAAKVRL
jgi:hypothetical protein